MAPVLHVSDAWAVMSGAAQVAVGLKRRGPLLGRKARRLRTWTV